MIDSKDTITIPTKLDTYSAVVARNFPVFDAPIKHERSFDYDDFEGIIDDLDNPYDQTYPVLVQIPPQIETNRTLDILGGKCFSCGIDNPMILKIDPLNRNSKPKNLNRLIEKMFQQGLDPSEKFQILCHNCNVLKTKINKERRKLGLPILSKISPNQGILN